ncbi:MAG: TRAP transporter permease [Synergistales bacterium]
MTSGASLDPSEKYFTLTGIYTKILVVACVVLSIIHLVNIWYVIPSNYLRSLHLGLLFPIVYLKADAKTTGFEFFIKTLKSLIGFGACLYYGVFFDDLVMRAVAPTSVDILVGVLLILVLIDAAMRTVGFGMAAVTMAFLAYVLFGQHLPGELGHYGYSFSRILGHLFISSNGIFGSMLQMSATYIALFTILGAFLESCGASDAFINVALRLTGRLQGGPALAAVIASCLFGTVNGSAVVNVITTGTFTIPLMKGIGIAPHVAGAVEAAASTGGQLMPPVMGAGAFVMSDITGVPYATIVIRAIIPALVYFIGVLAGVMLYVKRDNVPAVDPAIIPSTSEMMKGLHLLLPMVVVFVLIIGKFSPMYSAFYGIATAALLVLLNERKALSTMFQKLNAALIGGSLNLSSVAMGLACAGLIIGSITLTGLGSKFVSLVLALSGGYPIVALVFVAVAVLILGMGLPTSAAYVITATMAVPALLDMGFELIACHLFVFYFAVIAPVTPPVAIAAYAGAGIANADPTKTGYKAFIFALPAFLMPFMFIYNPLLLSNGSLPEILWAATTAVVGAVCLAGATQGFLLTKANRLYRAILILGALCLLKPGLYTDVAGIVILLAVTYLTRKAPVPHACH